MDETSTNYSPELQSQGLISPSGHDVRTGLTPSLPPSHSTYNMADYTSPSAYLNADAYASGESTPQHYDHSTSSSMSIPQPPSLDELYSLGYADYTSGEAGEMMSMAESPEHEISIDGPTPSAEAMRQEDRTPVVQDNQQQIPSSTYPAPPAQVMTANPGLRAQLAPDGKTLLSPWRPYPGMEGAMEEVSAMSSEQHLAYHIPLEGLPPHPQQPQYVDPSTGAIYFTTSHSQHVSPASYYETQPHHMAPHQPHPVSPLTYTYQGPINPQLYQQQQVSAQYYTTQTVNAEQQQYSFTGPPRDQHDSPTSSVSSSGPSLARSTSASSELRNQRPKVKLTFDDKRKIVELHRSNSSLRQEDIARMYGVDRSTISKIILAQHRWTQPPEHQISMAPKPAKTTGGRFPAIEKMMHHWFDTEIAAGRDVRDSIAREKAMEFGKAMGFHHDRFKASVKWLDKFKERRKLAGKPISSPVVSYGYYPYTTAPYAPMPHMAHMPHMGGPHPHHMEPMMLSRSQSAATLSSSASSQDVFQPSLQALTHQIVPQPPQAMNPPKMVSARSESDLLRIDTDPNSRSRSQSSPQLMSAPGAQTPSSGKAARHVRPSPLTLQRQNSYHGTSPSPRRPVPLTRSNTAQVLVRRTRPTSLAASAFGITPIKTEGTFAQSPICSPAGSMTSTSASSGVGGHTRQQSDVEASLVAPFQSSNMGGMQMSQISPNASESSETGGYVGMQVPLTPMTPGHGGHPNVYSSGGASGDYVDMANQGDYKVQIAHPGQHMPGGPQQVMPRAYYPQQGEHAPYHQHVESKPYVPHAQPMPQQYRQPTSAGYEYGQAYSQEHMKHPPQWQ